ncbi:hypothetical protein [Nonomuraea sp. NPDC049028]|uniref:hypothetical protein n=1 Tax=Nonomuraea sp. NPDC049028 TaxID=3364348 RepID=UPI003713983B
MIAARQRLKPRPRRKLRDVRWNVQWWAALTSVIAGLMSVPALIISMNALALGEQQQADARAQRAEDQKLRAQASADADELARTAFVRAVHIWPDYQVLTNVYQWNVRNSNSQPVEVYLRWTPVPAPSETNPALVWEMEAEPCSQSVMLPDFPLSIKESKKRVSGRFELVVVSGPEDAWVLDDFGGYSREPVNLTKWLAQDPGNSYTPVDPLHVKRAIVPCT